MAETPNRNPLASESITVGAGLDTKEAPFTTEANTAEQVLESEKPVTQQETQPEGGAEKPAPEDVIKNFNAETKDIKKSAAKLEEEIDVLKKKPKKKEEREAKKAELAQLQEEIEKRGPNEEEQNAQKGLKVEIKGVKDQIKKAKQESARNAQATMGQGGNPYLAEITKLEGELTAKQEALKLSPMATIERYNQDKEAAAEKERQEAEKAAEEAAKAEEERAKAEQAEKAKKELSGHFSPLFKTKTPEAAMAPKIETTQIDTGNVEGPAGQELKAEIAKTQEQNKAEEERIKAEQAEKVKLESHLLHPRTELLYKQATGEEFKPKVRESAVKEAEAQGLKVMKVSEFLTEARRQKTQEDIRNKVHSDAINDRWQNVLSEKARAGYGSIEKYKEELESKRKSLEQQGFSIPPDVFYGMVGVKNINVEGMGKAFLRNRINIPGSKEASLSKKDFEAWVQKSQGEWNKYIEGVANTRLNAIVEKGKKRMTGFKQEAAKEIIKDLISPEEGAGVEKGASKTKKAPEAAPGKNPEAAKAAAAPEVKPENAETPEMIRKQAADFLQEELKRYEEKLAREPANKDTNELQIKLYKAFLEKINLGDFFGQFSMDFTDPVDKKTYRARKRSVLDIFEERVSYYAGMSHLSDREEEYKERSKKAERIAGLIEGLKTKMPVATPEVKPENAETLEMIQKQVAAYLEEELKKYEERIGTAGLSANAIKDKVKLYKACIEKAKAGDLFGDIQMSTIDSIDKKKTHEWITSAYKELGQSTGYYKSMAGLNTGKKEEYQKRAEEASKVYELAKKLAPKPPETQGS